MTIPILRTSRLIAVAALSAACSGPPAVHTAENALAQSAGPTPSERYIDPVQVAPAHYRVLFENERVRVLEMTLAAGARDEPHSHPEETVYFTNGGSARITLVPDGEVMEVQIPDGGVLWHEPWTHQVENIGTSGIRAIIVESKSEIRAASASSTASPKANR